MLVRVIASILLLLPLSLFAQTSDIPGLDLFRAGDTWEWQQIDNRTRLEEGRSTRTVKVDNGELKFANTEGQLTTFSNQFVGRATISPWRNWPLEVGKKWVFESDWDRADGVKGNTRQDVVVASYEEVTVPAGTFMAFRIEHKGWFRNSRGSSGKQNDTYWYAPAAYADIKHSRDDGYNQYTRELVRYTPVVR